MKTWWENVLMVVVLAVIAALFGAVMSEGGHIDNGATRGYADAAVAAEAALRAAGDLAGSNGVPLVATNAANAVLAAFTPTGTVNNASNLNNVPANRYLTNIAEGVTDPWHAVSNITSYTFGTVTISRATGEYIALQPTSAVTIAFDDSFPTNGTSLLTLQLNPAGQTITFYSGISTNTATNTIPGTAGLALQTNQWNALTFFKSFGWTSWGVRQ